MMLMLYLSMWITNMVPCSSCVEADTSLRSEEAADVVALRVKATGTSATATKTKLADQKPQAVVSTSFQLARGIASMASADADVTLAGPGKRFVAASKIAHLLPEENGAAQRDYAISSRVRDQVAPVEFYSLKHSASTTSLH